MEQVLFRTHSKLVNLSVRCLHPFMRKTIEYTTLLLACYTAVILFVLHSTYISTSNVANYNCLITNDYVFQTVNRSNSYTDSYSCNSSHEYCINSNFYNCSRNWMDYVYLQPSETNSNIQNHNSYSYRNSYSSNSKCSDSNCRRGSNSALIDLYSHYDLIKLEIVQRRKFSIQNMWNTYVSQRVDSPTKCDYNDSNSSCNSNSNSYYENSIAGIDSNIDKHIYYYSSDRGLLLLRDELKAKHNFTMLTVVVDTSHICFGPSSYVWLIENMVGFDTVIVNWGLTAFQGIGYVFNTNSKQIFNLNYAEELFLSKGNSFFDKGKSINYDILNGETESMYSKSMSLLLPIHNTFLYLEKHVQELIHSINSKEIIIIHPSIHALVDKFVLFLNDYCIDNKVYQTVTNTLSSVYDSSRTSKDNLDRVDNYSGNSNDTEGLYLKLLRNNYRIMIKLVKQMKPFVSFRANVFVTTTFVFFVSTSLISFTLRETQERMLRFTYMLQHRITHRMPYLALVFKHVIESLVFVPIIVGITFFLFEFYSDQLLAFLVLLVVWMAEVFSVLSLRTKVNLQFFPKIFCCYFYLYHIYFFSNPFGFGYVSLAGLYLFTLHAMMYFMNVYEIPALVTGVVGPTRMRLGLVDYAPAVNINSPVRVEQRLGRANSQNSRNMQSTVRLSAVRSSAQSDGQCRRPGPLTSLLDESNDNRQAQQRRHRSLLENNPMEETDLRLTLDGDVDLPMQLLKNEAPIGPAFDVRESNKAANGLRERPSVETIPSSRAMSSSARQELDRISQSYCVEKRSVSNRGVESPLGYCLDDEIIFENPPTNHRKSRIHAASWTDSGTDGDIMKRSDQEISMDGNLSRGRGFTVSVPRIAPIHKAAETPPATFVAANIYETLDARRNRLQQIEVNNMKKMSPKKDSFKVPSIESDSKSSNSEDPSTKLFCRFASGLAEMNDSALSVHKEDTNNSETNLSIEASDEVKSGKKPAKNIDSEKSTAGQAVSSDDTCFDNNPIREGAKHHVKFEDEYHSVTASQTTANVGEIKNVGKNSSAQSGMKQIPSEGSIEGKYGRECSDFYMFGSDSYYYDSEEGY